MLVAVTHIIFVHWLPPHSPLIVGVGRVGEPWVVLDGLPGDDGGPLPEGALPPDGPGQARLRLLRPLAQGLGHGHRRVHEDTGVRDGWVFDCK